MFQKFHDFYFDSMWDFLFWQHLECQFLSTQSPHSPSHSQTYKIMEFTVVYSVYFLFIFLQFLYEK